MIQIDIERSKKYFDPRVCVVVEYGATEWGEEYPSVVLVGYARKYEDRIKYILPDPPKYQHEVLFHDLEKRRQKWRRFPEMPEWSWDYIRERAGLDFDGDIRWMDDDENLTPEQLDYRAAEFNRRANGLWLYINGRLTYITGKHYMSLQWSPMTGGGYPDYRERDMLWWWAWQACLEDPFCYGMVYLKHRRDGFSNRAVVDMLDSVTSQYAARGVITSSLDKDHAIQEIWTPILLPLLDAWPPFFIPETTSNEKPVGGVIDFDEPPRRGKSRVKKRRKGFGSRIAVKGASRKQSKADGGKIIRYFQDEPGKDKLHDIRKGWGTIKPALTAGGLIGRGLFGSTVEETDGALSLQFGRLVKESMPSEIKEDGFTESGLFFLFFPCDFCMDEDYVDEYGMSITYKPTDEQLDYQRRRQMSRLITQMGGNQRKADEAWVRIKAQKYDKGGSHQWVLNYRRAASDDVERSDRKRRFPLEPEDALLPSAKSSFFDQEILTSALVVAEQPDETGHPAWKSFVRFGKFEWADSWIPTEGEHKNNPMPLFKGNVKWVDYPEGHEMARFTVQRKMLLDDPYCPYKPNMVHRELARHGSEPYGIIRPMNPNLDGHKFHPNKLVFKIGCDPFEWDKKKTAQREADLSKAGSWCKWVLDEAVDSMVMGDTVEERAGNQKSNSYVWVYHARPSKADDFCEDMLQAAIYYGTPINVERDRSAAFQKNFEQWGCIGFLMVDQLSLANDSDSSTYDPLYGTKANHIIGFPFISTYVKLHIGHLHKFPFPMGIRQLLSVTMENIGQHDLVAGMEQTEMCKVTPNIRAVASLPQNSQLAHGVNQQAGKSKGTAPTYSMR